MPFALRAWIGRLAAALVLASAGAPVLAQAVSTSPGPGSVSVTIYRDPDRGADETMDLDWLEGFALVTETRQVSIPAGEADLRFEGVAGGIIPESAIVTGLPDGIVEKNQDAWLLSPASLLDRSLGKRVHLRRTVVATGEVREQDAVIRSGADGTVVLQTADGFEALRCTGIPETLVYDEVPEGLSARPTLSVRTRSRRAGTATVTLSYLATGFDWQANYVATLAPSEDRLELFAWVTLANGDETSFIDARAQAVAGRLNREESPVGHAEPADALDLRCWPSGTTSDIPEEDFGNLPPPPPPPAPPPMAMAMADEENIVVTGMRASKMVQQEELGDLKLYRVPEPVTVAAMSQKQVALLQRDSVKVESFYRLDVPWYGSPDELLPARRIIKARNRRQDGLGLPLPAGGVVVFGAGYRRPVLLGEGAVGDKAVDEDVEFELGDATGVLGRLVRTSGDNDEGTYRLTITNDRDRPVRLDAEFGDPGAVQVASATRGARFGRRSGRPVWSVKVPANGCATLEFNLKQVD